MDLPMTTACFLYLPAELRNIIYRLLVTLDLAPHKRRSSLAASKSTGTSTSASSPPAPRLLPLICLNLLATCRQIYTEASSILYAENTFVAHSTFLTQVPHLLDRTKPIRAPLCAGRIRRWYIEVRLDTDARFRARDVEQAFGGCEELRIDASQAMYLAAGNGVLMLFSGVRGVGKATVTGSVTDAFARWLECAMMSPEGTVVEKYVENGPYVSHHGDWNPWSDGNR